IAWGREIVRDGLSQDTRRHRTVISWSSPNRLTERGWRLIRVLLEHFVERGLGGESRVHRQRQHLEGSPVTGFDTALNLAHAIPVHEIVKGLSQLRIEYLGNLVRRAVQATREIGERQLAFLPRLLLLHDADQRLLEAYGLDVAKA